MSIGEFAKLVGRTVSTVQRWDREGILTAYRTNGQRRYYTLEHYLQVKGPDKAGKEEVVGYCRVINDSDSKDIDRQRNLITAYCANQSILITNWIYDSGSGFHLARSEICQLFDMIEIGVVRSIVVTHREVLLMHGYEWFERFCRRHIVNILVAADSMPEIDGYSRVNEEISFLMKELSGKIPI